MKIATDLRHLFTIGQQVKVRNDDFDVIDETRFDLGVVSDIKEDILTVYIPNLDINMYFMADFNLDMVYPIYNF